MKRRSRAPAPGAEAETAQRPDQRDQPQKTGREAGIDQQDTRQIVGLAHDAPFLG